MSDKTLPDHESQFHLDYALEQLKTVAEVERASENPNHEVLHRTLTSYAKLSLEVLKLRRPETARKARAR